VDLSAIPHSPGVYLMRDRGGAILYVGKARDLSKRVASYFAASRDHSAKIAALVASIHHVDYLPTESEREALILEQGLIRRLQPHFNSMWKDDKSYPYIKLTSKEDYPRLILTRRKVRDGSEYFGPYPQVLPIKKLVFWLVRVFKLRPCRIDIRLSDMPAESKVKSCLYLHTGKCYGPCLGKISSSEYGENSKAVSLFLSGKFLELKNSWEKEMAEASRVMDYERAADLRDRLNAIAQMQEKIVIREVAAEDVMLAIGKTNALKELKEKLGLPRLPVVIEGFDISNISGGLAVGSMVCFRNAQPDKSSYRKFRIKTVAGPDDFAMIKEVVCRRYKRLLNEKAKFPDLILIDGGRGQLSAATEILDKLGVKKTPIISLAKKREEIFMPDRENPVQLPVNSPALHVLERVRDEAHRFALSYHQNRRKNKLITGK